MPGMDQPRHAAAITPSDRATAVTGLLRMARVLAESGRPIDLTGLEQEVGRLCAASLDLAPAEGRAMRAELAAVLAELDALSACVAAAEAAP